MPRDYKVYIDREIIWDVIRNKIPELEKQIKKLI